MFLKLLSQWCIKLSINLLISNMDLNICRLYHTYETKNINNSVVPKVKTTSFGSEGILFSVVKMLNALPVEIRNCSTSAGFKVALKKWCYNTLNSYDISLRF